MNIEIRDLNKTGGLPLVFLAARENGFIVSGVDAAGAPANKVLVMPKEIIDAIVDATRRTGILPKPRKPATAGAGE